MTTIDLAPNRRGIWTAELRLGPGAAVLTATCLSGALWALIVWLLA